MSFTKLVAKNALILFILVRLREGFVTDSLTIEVMSIGRSSIIQLGGISIRRAMTSPT